MQVLVGLIDLKIEIKITGKAHSVNEDSAFNTLMFKKRIEDGRYTYQQIFSVNETGLFS
jgi:hypothetical protein